MLRTLYRSLQPCACVGSGSATLTLLEFARDISKYWTITVNFPSGRRNVSHFLYYVFVYSSSVQLRRFVSGDSVTVFHYQAVIQMHWLAMVCTVQVLHDQLSVAEFCRPTDWIQSEQAGNRQTGLNLPRFIRGLDNFILASSEHWGDLYKSRWSESLHLFSYCIRCNIHGHIFFAVWGITDKFAGVKFCSFSILHNEMHKKSCGLIFSRMLLREIRENKPTANISAYTVVSCLFTFNSMFGNVSNLSLV